jgi:hypothetical protein
MVLLWIETTETVAGHMVKIFKNNNKNLFGADLLE